MAEVKAFRVRCPQCGEAGVAQSLMVGRKVRCNSCGHGFTLKSPPGESLGPPCPRLSRAVIASWVGLMFFAVIFFPSVFCFVLEQLGWQPSVSWSWSPGSILKELEERPFTTGCCWGQRSGTRWTTGCGCAPTRQRGAATIVEGVQGGPAWRCRALVGDQGRLETGGRW